MGSLRPPLPRPDLALTAGFGGGHPPPHRRPRRGQGQGGAADITQSGPPTPPRPADRAPPLPRPRPPRCQGAGPALLSSRRVVDSRSRCRDPFRARRRASLGLSFPLRAMEATTAHSSGVLMKAGGPSRCLLWCPRPGPDADARPGFTVNCWCHIAERCPLAGAGSGQPHPRGQPGGVQAQLPGA